MAKRNEMQTVNRLLGLPFRLNKDQRIWLEAMRKDKREEVRSTAEWIYGERYGWMELQRKEMEEEWEDDSELPFE